MQYLVACMYRFILTYRHERTNIYLLTKARANFGSKAASLQSYTCQFTWTRNVLIQPHCAVCLYLYSIIHLSLAPACTSIYIILKNLFMLMKFILLSLAPVHTLLSTKDMNPRANNIGVAIDFGWH